MKTVKSKKVKPLSETQSSNQTSGNLISFLPFRFWFTTALIVLMFLALLWKGYLLQIYNADWYINQADKRSFRSQELPFTRGKILDRNGRYLSISVPLYSITIDPREYFDSLLRREKRHWKLLAQEVGIEPKKVINAVETFLKPERGDNGKEKARSAEKSYDARMIFNYRQDGYWRLLAKITGIDYDELITKVRHNPNSQFLQSEAQIAQLATDKLKLLSKQANVKYSELLDLLYRKANDRFAYIARHQSEIVADFTNQLDIDGVIIKTEFRRFYPLGEEISQLIGFTNLENTQGIEGLERSFNGLLVGKNGRTEYRKDSKYNVIQQISHQDKYDAPDIKLSIDEELQSMAYREIKKAVIENKAESGTAVLVDIQTGEILAMANAPSYNPNNRSDFKPELARNRAITDTFEPGSTVKPLVVLTALQNKVTYLGEVINTHSFEVNGHMIKDVSPKDSLTLTGILQKSSNVGVSRLALRMPSTALVETYSKIGFGKDTGLGLGEQRGSNGDRKRWSDIERATLAYGYGLSVTPLQLARAYATLGSFGIYRPLSITKVDPPVIGERVLPEKITQEVVHMMESVAQKGEGGAKAAVDGYRVAIKTGTARKLEKGQYVEKYLAYTAGIAPASNPRFALVVLINEPKSGAYYGGAISAPLFSKIMGYTLKSQNIKPDNLTEDTKSAVREFRTDPIN